MLKVHAFVRESAPKVLSYKKTQGKQVSIATLTISGLNHELSSTKSPFFLSGQKDNSEPPVEADQADEGTDNSTNRDKTVKENQPLPEFGQYLYFLFCPTLIYRDQYPM